MKQIIFFTCLIFSGIVPEIMAQDATYERVVHVWMTRDGDSYMVSNYIDQSDTTKGYEPYSKAYAVRLFGVDTPENLNPYVGKEQPHAKQSGNAVRALMTGKIVKLDSVTTDQYGRLVARVQLPDGLDLAKLVVARGLGWSYFPDYPKRPSAFLKEYRGEIQDLHNFARDNKIGLFLLRRSERRHPFKWRKLYPGGGA